MFFRTFHLKVHTKLNAHNHSHWLHKYLTLSWTWGFSILSRALIALRIVFVAKSSFPCFLILTPTWSPSSLLSKTTSCHPPLPVMLKCSKLVMNYKTGNLLGTSMYVAIRCIRQDIKSLYISQLKSRLRNPVEQNIRHKKSVHLSAEKQIEEPCAITCTYTLVMV